MPNSRDPRLDPKVGDKLFKSPVHAEVTMVDRRVYYILTNPLSRSAVDRIPMRCDMAKKSWRDYFSNADVIHAAE